MQILIVDDNQEMLFGLERLLNEAKFNTHTASTLAQAQEALDRYEYDLIVLDWMLPDGSGVAFLKALRQAYLVTPVLLLSSKSEVEERVEALDGGADDYLGKPFSNIELLARIRALLRRESTLKRSEISLGRLHVDLATHKVTIDNQPISLTKKEFQLLELLLLNQNVVLTRYQINDHLTHDFDALKSSNLVDAHIKNLRKKFGDASEMIETVRGVGFRIRATQT